MEQDAYLFSRRDWAGGLELDDFDPVTMAGYVFFQMWRTRAFPYLSFQQGDLVYIGDQRRRTIRWEVRVSDLLTDFQYRSRRHALAALRAAYGARAEDLNDYHRTRPEQGWLLAWAPIVMRQLDIALPEGVTFGRNGYRRLSEADRAAAGLPQPRRGSAVPLASPPPWYDPAAATTGAPRVVPRYIPAHIARAVWERDNGQCVGCGRREDLHLDHIQPYSFGGPATVDNLRLLCARSNLAKGAGDPGTQLKCQEERSG
jgi:hypothetical protein